jgi:redox-sensitive bicupin YhaK (pirin superfamily)
MKIEGKKSDLGGGLTIHRILPNQKKRMVGPFCFFDHMGPVIAGPEQNTDVRPHPHIGLSTLTYLFEGRIAHRDSLGSNAVIEPGAANWMTAGRGISHSERTPSSDRSSTRHLHGLQFWVALPIEKEECDPSFKHYSQELIPSTENEERKISVIAGDAFGLSSPVETSSPLLFTVIEAKKDFTFSLPSSHFELAIYMVNGFAKLQNEELQDHQLLVLENLSPIEVRAGSRFALFGGETMPEGRHIWWNLVSSSKEKIEAAKRQWIEGKFPMVPGEVEFIPVPEF